MVIDLDHSSGEHHKEKEDSGLYTHGMIVEHARRQLCSTDGASGSGSTNDCLDRENAGHNLNGRTSNGEYMMPSNDPLVMSCHRNLEPCDGMEFDSKEDAFSFYQEYAKSTGFSIIIKASRRSRISGKFIDAKFVCTRYGSKRESCTSVAEPVPSADGTGSIHVRRKRGRINRSWSKTDCKACLHVKRRSDGRWIIRTFVKEHNHEILSNQTYYVQGHRNIDKISTDAFHSIRGKAKKTYATLPRQSGVMKKVEKQKNGGINGSSQPLALDEADVQVMLEHFLLMQDENPNFFYAMDLSQEQLLRNVFWVDAKGRLDYGNFNDVVLFDTTCIKNEYKLPFVSFIGVNHHFQSISLGCGLIADESKSTFVWLMRAWLRAMGGQAPKVILTDQDTTMKEVIAEVFPDSRHCFCLWHIQSKIQEKLGYVIRQHESFLSKFSKCILRSATNEVFEKRWWKVVDRFDLRNDSWIKSLYEDRLRWVPTYMNNIFLAGMSTIQRLENSSFLLDKCVLRKTTLKGFLDQYKTLLQEKCEEEAKADFETRHKQPGLKSPSPFEKQMATLYTHTMFKKFQIEVLGVVACHPKQESDDGAAAIYRVKDFEEKQDFVVVWNEMTSDTSCSCHLFEYNGFLCRHVMIVLQMAGVHNIPSKYILKRWTKGAKSRETMRQVNLVESRVQRYTDLCQRAFELGDEGSLSQQSYNSVFDMLEKVLRKCESVNNSNQNDLEPCSPSNQGLDVLEVFTESNSPSNNNQKNMARKDKVHKEQTISAGINNRWQQMGQSSLGEPAVNRPFGSHEAMQPMDQISSSVPTPDGYYSSPQMIQVVGQLGTITQSYGSQPNMQGLGQLNVIAPMSDGPYLSQPRLHGLGQLYFSPRVAQSSFEVQDSLQDMSSVANTEMLRLASESLRLKNLS